VSIDNASSSSLSTRTSTAPVALVDDLDLVIEELSGTRRAVRTVTGPSSGPSLAPAAMPARPLAPALPVVAPPPSSAPTSPELSAQRRSELQGRIEALAAEARAAQTAGSTSAAALWFEIGRIHEHDLGSARDAAENYQRAWSVDSNHLPVLHAARRLFTQRRKWGMVLLLLDEELRLPGAPVASLLVEKAGIFAGCLQRVDEAMLLHQRVLELDPAHPVAVDAVVRGLAQAQRWSEVVDVLLAAADAAVRPALRTAWLSEAAHHCETRLGDDARALELFERIEVLQPGRRSVLEALRRLHARRGDDARLGAVLERLAESSTTPDESVAWWSQRARVAIAGGGEAGERVAVAALEAARATSPHDLGVLEELSRLYERQAMWPSFAETLEARAEAAQEIRDRAELLADAARVAEEHLGDLERAIRLYRASVDLDPHNAEVLASLGRLFARTRRFDDLSHVYDMQLQGLTDPQQKLPLLFKHAELLATTLDDDEGALRCLQEILEFAPGFVPAARMAASLSAKLERWTDLIALWENQLADNGGRDRSLALYLLEKIAGVHEDRLRDPSTAAATYERMLRLQPGNLPALRKLSRLYASLEQWDQVIRINSEEAESIADQNIILSLWHRNGEILADKLGRIDDAIDAFLRALALMPTYLPALKALGAIYARDGRWPELIAMHRLEAEAARGPDHRVHLLYAAARLTLEKLGDVDGAVVAFRDVLKHAPAHRPTLHALEQIARQSSDHVARLEVLQGILESLSDPRAAAEQRCRIAEHLENSLGRTDDAVAVLETALADDPTLLHAHEQLITLLARTGRTAAEASAREGVQDHLPNDAARIANLRALVALYLHHLDAPTRARDAAGRLLQLAPDDRAALRTVLVCALRQRDYVGAIDAASQLAQFEPAADEVCNLHLQVARWREFHVEPAQDPLPDYVRILQYQPHHPIAVVALERLYAERQAWEALFALYELQAPALTEPTLVVDNEMKMGRLAEDRLGRPDVARGCYERALAVSGDHLPAIARLKELYGREGRPQDQLRLLGLEAQTSKDPAHAIRTLLEVGALQRDRFQDVDAAAACFSRILDREPRHAEAYAALEALLTRSGRMKELARLLERAADTLALDGPSTTPQQVDLLLRAVQIHHEGLGDAQAAAQLLDRVLRLAPGNPPALYQLATLRLTLADWDAAIAAFDALLPHATEPQAALRVHVHLGTLFVKHRVDGRRAVKHLVTALALQPENRAVRTLLARAWELADAPTEALQAYEELLATAPDPVERRELHGTLARLYESAGQPLRAARHLEAVLQHGSDPGGARALLARVISLYDRAGDIAGLVEATARQAEALAVEAPARGAELFFAVARLRLERQRDPNGALAAARRAQDLAPDALEIRGFIADIYSSSGSQQALAIEEHRRVLRAGLLRVASLHGLYKSWSNQRAYDRAFCAAELLSFLSAADDGEELFFADNKKRMKKDSAAQLTPEQLTSWVAHPAQRTVVREVLVAVAADLAKIFAADDLENLDKRFILRGKADDPLRSLADNVAQNIGVPGFDVWRSQTRKSGVECYAGVPLVLSVGLDVTRTHPTREQRFLLARKLVSLQSGHHLLRGLDARGLGLLLTAIGRSQEKNFPLVGTSEGPELEAWVKRVGGALSRKTRTLIADPLAQLAASPTVDLAGFLAAQPLTENRAGLLLCGALDAAIRLVARDTGASLAGNTAMLVQSLEQNTQLVDLVAFGLSDEFFQARQALRLAIDT
jgi:tetratricopeptide (TPR) repeat protein